MNSMPRSNPQAQRGVTLIEVMIAILIFAIGVLGLVGLQARAVQHSSQAKYRADASLLANELIGQMWTDARTPANLKAKFSSAPTGPSFTAWQAKVTNTLPGAALFPPQVTVTEVKPLPSATPVAGLLSSAQVTIVIRWKPPQVAASEPPNNLTVTTEIK
jgi:type IV pilus assembly protein PilV